MNLLVIEDESGVRELVRKLAMAEGWAVFEAENGLAGLEILRGKGKAPVDLVLLDLSLPVVDGWQVLMTKARDPAIASIPIVVMTGALETPHGPDVVALLEKPFSAGELRELLRMWRPPPRDA
jgi:adenylate cyclase